MATTFVYASPNFETIHPYLTVYLGTPSNVHIEIASVLSSSDTRVCSPRCLPRNHCRVRTIDRCQSASTSIRGLVQKLWNAIALLRRLRELVFWLDSGRLGLAIKKLKKKLKEKKKLVALGLPAKESFTRASSSSPFCLSDERETVSTSQA